MKLLHNHINRLLLGIMLIATFTSCDEDWWRDDILSDLCGGWRVVEVTGYSAYRTGDRFWFYEDGTFLTEGHSLNERGEWHGRGRQIDISFDGYNVDISAYIRSYSGDYMVLDMSDYYDNSRYTLRLTRTHY